MRRQRVRWLAPLCALAVVAIGAGSTAVAAGTNLVANGTFEGSGSGSLSGWGGSSGSLSLVTGNGGGHAAKLAASSRASSTYAYTSSKPVKSAVAGAAYQLSGDVQSSLAGQSVCLVLKEIKSGGTATVASGQTCISPGSSWQSFPTVNYTVKTTGDSLTVNVLEKPAVAGANFAFDNIVLQAGSSGGGDTQPPTVPQNVAAGANSSTSVTVTWDASTDDTAVAGYDVYRDGTKVGTAGGSQTSFTDTAVQPSTTYSYTVDAFDAVPNTSAQSSPPASVTTPSGAGGGDTQPPTVPQNVAAGANSSTSVTVTWDASTDDTAVAGYDVYRDGTKVGTAGGSQTSFTDAAVQPSTTYSYTVDAFDAVPNTSAQSSPPASVTTPSGGGSGPAEPIIVIMMENKHYSDIVGNTTSAPYIQSLIAQGTLYTNYQAAPGSLPDYLLNTSGLNSTTTAAGSDNIFHQLQTAGVSWGEYEESMPGTCYTGGDQLPYKKGHNPAVYYKDITSSPAACGNVVPYSAFDPSHLRAFSYIAPNMSHDMHDGATRAAQIAAGDNWLAANVPAMLNAGAEVILTWDEGSASDEHVATIAIGGTAAAGATDSHAYTHPGLLAGLEDAWGLPRLNAASSATPLPIH
ncbi:MAG TPA: alkaline phosphatase family protein [Gaiellales bacterium]|nr:alkaline phosphatase family protein [Gaiellales bacterium]